MLFCLEFIDVAKIREQTIGAVQSGTVDYRDSKNDGGVQTGHLYSTASYGNKIVGSHHVVHPVLYHVMMCEQDLTIHSIKTKLPVLKHLMMCSRGDDKLRVSRLPKQCA